MIYKDFKDLKLSWLGMGNMRLPVVGERGPIDEKNAQKIIDYAYENGVNYFDTAFGYHGGESEKFIGKALSKYPRDSWYLASKMPGHMMTYENGKLGYTGYMKGSTMESIEEIFEMQLDKCGVDYFDFYLLHNICETSYDFFTNKELGVLEYLQAQKKAGRIRHLGFSAHGRAETIDKFLDWTDAMEFAQIQLNYMDWILQDAGKKYEVLTKRNIPVIVMEPCRGGRLASLNPVADGILKEARPKDSIASWSFRFLQSLPNILVVLSGMSTMEQIQENVELFSKCDPVTEEENQLLKKAMETMMDLVPCTGCRYCVDGCPASLDIPKLISIHNEISFEYLFTVDFTLKAMEEKELPSACVACGACSKLCPQNIDIPDVLKKFSQTLEERNK